MKNGAKRIYFKTLELVCLDCCDVLQGNHPKEAKVPQCRNCGVGGLRKDWKDKVKRDGE